LNKIFEDIRVLDLTDHWFGPWCTMMLADLGAEVIKIEPPWGATGRIGSGALYGGVSHTFHYLNMGKKAMAIDLKAPRGIEVFKELVKKSDVVVQNFSAGTMERLGLGYDVLRELNPGIIYAALSGFGQTGPYSTRGSFANIAEGMSGHTRLTGDRVDPKGPPIPMAQAYGDLGPGTVAAMSVMAAIRHRDRTGEGQMIDVAQLDCMVALNPAIVSYTLSGMLPWQLREKYPMANVSGLFEVKDGWITVAGHRPKAIDELKARLGVDEITREVIRDLAAGMTRDEAVDLLVEVGLPVAPIYDVSDTVADPHLAARGMFVEVDHPKAGKIKVPNFPVKFSGTPGEVTSSAPLLGQDNREILKEVLGYTVEQIGELEKERVIVTE
jgi:CoA:oxalate CoA-transferase